MKKRIVIVIFAALLVLVVGLVYYGQRRAGKGEMYYSGTIEAIESNLAFQASGSVIRVEAREGEAVRTGDVLAELDSSEFAARLDQARAALEKAVKAKEQLEELLAIYSSTLPEDVRRARANVDVARNTMIDSKRNDERYEELFRRGVVSQKERDSVNLAYENSLSKLHEADAVLAQAESNLRKIDSTKKDIEAAQAQIDLSKAALEQAKIQLGYTKLTAPYSGIITSRNVEPGEFVSPGREVLSLSDLSRVDLKVFVDETDIGKVRPNQKVDVVVDAFPGKFFKGRVSYISPEAEFTPKIIQTKKERVKLVYLVKVSVPNPKFELKTGMPADAFLR
ncbi:MAG TPA: efflux RND transporter periplasmic adaptor subunit [Deltaproteobacteria bacterium]|nr:efflux RND transporter periplasmic adaptor subunit [Deltaproteobacteria bacterium]HQJ07436.1 efflux RND transporter periplasmic adaptor subunit [Deltaproteobacteria bacterium]